MPIINLIQEQRQAAERVDQQTRIAFLTFVSTGVLGALGFGILFYQRESLLAEIARVTADLDKLKPVIAQIEACEKQQSLLKPRLDSLQTAQQMSGRWAAILTHLQTQTPSDTWLTGLQSTAVDQSKPTNVIFTGSSKAQQPIAEFVLRTQNEANLDNVVLHFTQEKRAVNGKTIDFEVAGELVGSLEKKKPLVKEEGSKS